MPVSAHLQHPHTGVYARILGLFPAIPLLGSFVALSTGKATGDIQKQSGSEAATCLAASGASN